jgi:hypothetical protein
MSTITIGNSSANAYVQTGDNTGNLAFVAVGGIINASAMSGAVSIPAGTTAQRPSSTANGMIRYNSNTSSLEVFIASSWVTFP